MRINPGFLFFLFFVFMVGMIFGQTKPPAIAGATPSPDAAQSSPVSSSPQPEPRPYVYREADGKKLQAFVFAPQGATPGKPTAAILLFHGGGWVMGSAEWCFDAARDFAAAGLLAVAVEYRLSEGKVTPMESLDDARAAFRWIRAQAAEFNIDPKRVAGYGVSAGGHIVAAAATIDFPGDKTAPADSKPDLLLLWSGVLDVASNEYFTKLLQGRGNAADYSPSQHAGASTPPTCIIHGEKDAYIPLSEVDGFKNRVVRAGGVCETHIYPGVGHLLTRNIANQAAEVDPDPKFVEDGTAKFHAFLRARGFAN